MSETPETQDISAVMVAYAKAFTDDLRALLGVDITIGKPDVATVEAGEVNQDDFPVAQTVCSSEQQEDQVYFCTVSREVSVKLVCLLKGHSEERMKEMRELPLDAETLDAFGEVMNLATAVLSRMFTDQYSLPPLGVVSTTDVASPKKDPPWKDCEALAVVRCPIAIPGSEDEGSLAMIFPPDVAHAWFGMQIGPYKTSGPAATSDHDLGAVEPTQIVFIEPSEEIRNEIEELEEGMIHSIWTMDPEEFDPDEMEEFADVGAFFIEWDLAFRTGLDLLECLRQADVTRNIPVLMMSKAPTDSKVRTAIRSGADSFVSKPLDTDEFQARLDLLLRERQRLLAVAG